MASNITYAARNYRNGARALIIVAAANAPRHLCIALARKQRSTQAKNAPRACRAACVNRSNAHARGAPPLARLALIVLSSAEVAKASARRHEKQRRMAWWQAAAAMKKRNVERRIKAAAQTPSAIMKRRDKHIKCGEIIWRNNKASRAA